MDSTYAPQSPDLSSFLSSKPQQPQPQSQQSQQSHQHHHEPYQHHPQSPEDSLSYAPRSPTLPFNQPDPFLHGHQQQHHLPHDLSHQHHHQQQQRSFSLGERRFSDYSDSTQYMPPVSAVLPSQAQPFASPSQYYNPQPIKTEPAYNTAPYDPASTSTTTGSMSRAPRGIKGEPSSSSSAFLLPTSAPTHGKPPPPSIDIRTKFPVARIKRIMQADEEVGKVAQVTPVAVNKALELFMTALVLGAADRAREKGGKRITAAHLKSVVEADEQFDFLSDIVGRVQETTEGAGGPGKRKSGVRAADSDSDDDSGERKVKKGKGRRKKSEGL